MVAKALGHTYYRPNKNSQVAYYHRLIQRFEPKWIKLLQETEETIKNDHNEETFTNLLEAWKGKTPQLLLQYINYGSNELLKNIIN